MTKQVIFLITISVLTTICNGQTLNLYSPSKAYDKYKSGQFFLEKGADNKFQNQGMYHSSYYYLNPDQTFIYYNVFEVGYKMTLGHWTREGNQIMLTWDSVATHKAVTDTSFYYKYFRYGKPKPLKMVNKKFIYTDTLITPIRE
ncbi:MAG: hypothetical protein WAQ28_19180 [Bacteroidia bacterium]